MAAQEENVTQENEIPPLEAPRGLKILVIVLGIAIVVMLALIIFKIADNVTKTVEPSLMEENQVEVVEEKTARIELSGGVMSITRPAGYELTETKVTATDIVLHFRSSTQPDIIKVVNRTANTVLEIRVTDEAANQQ